jgi:hypothetical protein
MNDGHAPGQLSMPAAPAAAIRAIEVRRSDRRRRTVAARLEGDRLVVFVPARMSAAEEAMWIERMRQRIEARRRRVTLNGSDALEQRARALNNRYFDGRLTWASVAFVTNQEHRFGSCTPRDGTIRLSDRLAGMPAWVLDYVLVHELAHLVEANHSQAFWRLVARYPLTERARGFLIAKGMEE